MLYCFAFTVCCDFTTDSQEELDRHEETAHPIQWKIVGRKKYGRLGWINIFERVNS